MTKLRLKHIPEDLREGDKCPHCGGQLELAWARSCGCLLWCRDEHTHRRVATTVEQDEIFIMILSGETDEVSCT